MNFDMSSNPFSKKKVSVFFFIFKTKCIGVVDLRNKVLNDKYAPLAKFVLYLSGGEAAWHLF